MSNATWLLSLLAATALSGILLAWVGHVSYLRGLLLAAGVIFAGLLAGMP